MKYGDLVFIGVLCVLVVVVTLVLKGFKLEQTELMNLTAEHCCNGDFCTNTYYNVNTGECEYFSGETIGFKITKEAIITFFGLIIVAFFIGYFLQKYRIKKLESK